jgi:hypothetical protein
MLALLAYTQPERAFKTAPFDQCKLRLLSEESCRHCIEYILSVSDINKYA